MFCTLLSDIADNIPIVLTSKLLEIKICHVKNIREVTYRICTDRSPTKRRLYKKYSNHFIVKISQEKDMFLLIVIFILTINYTQQYKLGKLLIVSIFMLNINYTQQFKLGKLIIVFIFMLNINYTQQYKLGKLLIVFIFMLNINYTQQYKLGNLHIVFIFMLNINYTHQYK